MPARNPISRSRIDLGGREHQVAERLLADVTEPIAGERIERYAGLPEQFRRGVHGVKRRRPSLGNAEAIVDVARPVDAEAHEEAMLLQERRPLTVEQCAVGLQVVLDPPARLPGAAVGGLTPGRAAGDCLRAMAIRARGNSREGSAPAIGLEEADPLRLAYCQGDEMSVVGIGASCRRRVTGTSLADTQSMMVCTPTPEKPSA